MQTMSDYPDLWQFNIAVTHDQGEILAEVLEPLTVAITFFEKPIDSNKWQVEGICDRPVTVEELSHLVTPFCQDTSSLTVEKLPKTDWLAENRSAFPPLRLAGFYVYGSHVFDPDPQNDIALKIDASTAFGTGNHGTTHGCLKALQDLKAEGFVPKASLDLGCGTGILALGIVKLFGVKTVATDYDPEAVEKTIFNAKENQVADKIESFSAMGLDHPDLQNEQFDLVTANILAKPLIDLASDLSRAISQDGFLILSGIMNDQSAKVLDAYLLTRAFTLVREEQINGWTTLTLCKNA